MVEEFKVPGFFGWRVVGSKPSTLNPQTRFALLFVSTMGLVALSAALGVKTLNPPYRGGRLAKWKPLAGPAKFLTAPSSSEMPLKTFWGLGLDILWIGVVGFGGLEFGASGFGLRFRAGLQKCFCHRELQPFIHVARQSYQSAGASFIVQGLGLL